MIFTSTVFLVWFLPATLLVYALAPRSWRTYVLALLSFVFYGWWRPDFVLLMLGSSLLDFYVGGAIERSDDPRRRRRLLLVSVVANLGLLGWFKYANFGVETLNTILASMGVAPLGWTAVVLPVGISFYTFQSMSYTIDVYRREVPATRSVAGFVAYVALFPQLVAGPIVRYRDVADQLRSRTHSLTKFSTGALLFQIGFAKKILIADTVAPLADAAFGAAAPSLADAWIGLLAYAFQIYFDFSGYSDMAIGLGLLFGFAFPVNFDSPYRSRSITEFWRRWHISLSTWLRDYLYIPLGGSRAGAVRTRVNLALTMLLGGLWHGAAFTFIAWGAWQGSWLILERQLGRRAPWTALPAPLAVAATFVIALGGWVFFRATSMGGAMAYFASLAGAGGGGFAPAMEVRPLHVAGLVVAAAVAFGGRPSHRIALNPGYAAGLLAPLLFAAAVVHRFFQSWSPFLYFQF